MDSSLPSPGFESIAGLELTDESVRGFAADGITLPTAVQRAAIPGILAGDHVVIQSGTGTGKTLAYLLPVLQRLRHSGDARAVCFAPSAELALQTLRVAERYKAPGVKALALVSGGNIKQQLARLQKSTQFVVGTTGRILEMFEKRKLKAITTIVLDEPEPILASRDADYLREIVSRPEPRVQLILAAATFGMNAERWITELMGPAAVRLRVDEDPARSLIEHHFVRVRDEAFKDRQLVRFIEDNRCRRAIVFVNQPNLVRHLYRFLNESGITPVTVTPERSKLERQKALLAFGRSEARVLLTMDSAATGLDVPDVPWVLHYELPPSAPAYLHRAGRTGRAGHSGRSVSFINDAERARLERIATELDLTLSAFPS
jgi:ATP-dependent RNA helicase DeaD